MSATRRDFLSSTARAGSLGAAAWLTPMAGWMVQPAPAPLRILILGGTGFIGPHQVRYAVARGHKVTCSIAARRIPERPRRRRAPRRRSQRQPRRAEGNRKWDAVIDNPTTLPRWVTSAAAAC